MDKNVSGVDLEELLKAREELNNERGIETDPNMYSDYNPNREEQRNEENEVSAENSYENITDSSNDNSSLDALINEDKTEEIVDENDYKSSLDEEPKQTETSEVNTNLNGGSEENLSKFGAFSAFEIKDNVQNTSSDETSSNIQLPLQENKPLETETTEENNDAELDKKLDAIDNASELENVLNNLLDELDKEDEEEQENSDNNAVEVDIEPKFEDIEKTSDEAQENIASSEETDIETEETEKQEDSNPISDFSLDDILDLADTTESEERSETEQKDEVLDLNDLNEETKTPEIVIENEQIAQETPENQEDNSQETEIITDYSKLTEILQQKLKETEAEAEEKINEAEEEVEDEEKYEKYAKIDDFKFINELTSDEFKKSDKFSYILGKNEKNELVFGNFKEHFNLAVFGKNDMVVNQFLNTMILSLCLKNSFHDINFVLLDSNINSEFEVYNKSSYLYFNRIAKTNKEILDTLIEVSKEVDNRYEKLASLGVKNIENYNEIAIENAITPMPYILLVFNNYTSATEATYNDKINACLYQILKFGRIAGIYAVVTAKLPIEINQVNYNLSSRLSFKSDEDSRFTVGSKGAEELPNEDDALYYNISSNSVTHVKTATLSSTELDLIIKDLEE